MKDKDTESVLVDIAKIVTQYSDKQFLKRCSGDVLSYMGVRLSALKASLIDVKVESQSKMLQAETDMETAKGVAYAKFKVSDGATAAQDMKNTDEDYIAAKRNFNTAKVEYEKLKSIVSDTHDLIDSIKGRVIDLGGARRDERS